jgi:hypothetical protein
MSVLALGSIKGLAKILAIAILRDARSPNNTRDRWQRFQVLNPAATSPDAPRAFVTPLMVLKVQAVTIRGLEKI